jgi:putative ABC transport system permease protein
MMGPLVLAIRHATHHRVRSLLLLFCIALAVVLPASTRVLSRRFEEQLRARAMSTPLVAGAKGSRFDLVMSALYFRRTDIATVSMADWRSIAAFGLGDAIPLNIRFTARGFPIVAAPPDYLGMRGLRVRTGSAPTELGEVALGGSVAQRLNLRPGDALFSDQRELYDISKPPALKMRVCGLLESTGGPDDEAVFVDIKTAWILEGISHGHADAATQVPGEFVVERTDRSVTVSEALVDYNEVTDANKGTFHVHGDLALLPLTGIIIVPGSEKERSILKARLNAGPLVQVVSPMDVVNEVLGQVVRLRQLLDAVAWLIGIVTGVLIALVTALSVRVRAREIQTLSRIGASRATVFWMFGWEIVIVLALGTGLAAAGIAALRLIPLDLFKLL